MSKKMTMREKNNLKMGLMSCVEQIGFVFFTMVETIDEIDVFLQSLFAIVVTMNRMF